ncbi:iron-containing alcohol dehydrogenase [Klebsiella variicola]|uniref:iron-containing alcohol dehydrogenase n=1 Tax=Klebsiella variicola TaxID=244366 RepID=UPI0010332368|nr:iron-containing alcohol dehydrogenase [Klebsiella variicola]QIS51575.1 iron-containing alcohol dehydrogenase [Klebsiella variicola]HBS5428243.1 iron-containing alcohol dehydrogenase [Klebsiella variicola subsp. variicola]HCI6140535.1 iron-containing alcohol dehydrogenase [Klebsiella variicola subsp. variicola]
MQNFTWYNPTTLDFGKDKEKQIGGHLAKHGSRHVLLCYGSDRIKRDGLFATVTASLAEHGITFVECGGIVSNPTLSRVREGIVLAREDNVDAVLSVGGGSVLDSAKAIAAGARYKGDVWDLFVGKGNIDSALPVFDILTLAATGSEMNSGAVVTNEETAQKYAIHSVHLFPVVSVVNPDLMKTLSRDYLVYSAADIIAHAIEGYFTASHQPHFQSRMVEAIVNTVLESTEKLLKDASDYDARAEFAWAATQALSGLLYSGTGGFSYPNHMIEHALSALFNVPHGAGLSVVMPAWMKWYQSRNPEQFSRFAREIFGLESADQGIAALEAWFDKIGTPTRLSQLEINDVTPELVDIVLENAGWFGIGEIYTREAIVDILNRAK